jgi:hypothetical protein
MSLLEISPERQHGRQSCGYAVEKVLQYIFKSSHLSHLSLSSGSSVNVT